MKYESSSGWNVVALITQCHHSEGKSYSFAGAVVEVGVVFLRDVI